jgi:hypothetical protein
MAVTGAVTRITMQEIAGWCDPLPGRRPGEVVPMVIEPRFTDPAIAWHMTLTEGEAGRQHFTVTIDSLPDGWRWPDFGAAFMGVFLRAERVPPARARQLTTAPEAFSAMHAPAHPRPLAALPPRRIAVLVRSHIAKSAKADQLADQLAAATGWDVYFAADETRGPVDSGRHPKVPHSLQMCADLGLDTEHPKVMWHYGDYALYCTFTQIPQYDFYLMFEFDVALRAAGSDYFQRLCDALRAEANRDLDFLGTYLRALEIGRPARPHRFRRGYKSILPIMGVSRRALLRLFEGRLTERQSLPLEDGGGTYCEYYVPSVLLQSDEFRCLGLNALVPGSIDRDSFNTNVARPLGHEDIVPATAELLHPVVEMDTFLRKALGVCGKAHRLDRFLGWLDELERRGVSNPAFATYRESAAVYEQRMARFQAQAEKAAAKAKAAAATAAADGALVSSP